MDEQLLRLVDHQAIVDAMYAYATAVDLNRPDEQVKVFTEGCRVNYGAGDAGWIHGREALREALRAALAEFVATNHRITNIEIDFAGADAATAVSSVYAWHRYADDRPDFHVFGRYHDVWERTADGWRMSERRLKVAGAINGPDADELEPIGRNSSSSSFLPPNG